MWHEPPEIETEKTTDSHAKLEETKSLIQPAIRQNHKC